MWTDRFEDLLVEETVENLTEAPRSPRQTQGKLTKQKETLEAAHSKGVSDLETQICYFELQGRSCNKLNFLDHLSSMPYGQ